MTRRQSGQRSQSVPSPVRDATAESQPDSRRGGTPPPRSVAPPGIAVQRKAKRKRDRIRKGHASAVHERGRGPFPSEVVQPPAGPIEAQTQGPTARSAPKDAPGTVATEPGDRTGPGAVEARDTVAAVRDNPIPAECSTCGERLVPAPPELAPLTYVCPLDPSIASLLGRPWPESHEHDDRGVQRRDETPEPTHQQDGRGADGHEHCPEPESVKGLESHRVASPPSQVDATGLGEQTTHDSGHGPTDDDQDKLRADSHGRVRMQTSLEGSTTPDGASRCDDAPEPERDENVNDHEASGDKSSRGASARGDGLRASPPRLPVESVAEHASREPLADPLRAIDPKASVCTTCGRELPQRGLCAECHFDWYWRSELKLIGYVAGMCADEVRAVLREGGRTDDEIDELVQQASGTGSKCAADEPASPARGSAAPSGDAPEGAASALGKIGSYSSTGEKQGAPESAACGPETASGTGKEAHRQPRPTGQIPCPHCDETSCENGCHCTTCGGMHAVAAYTCEQCGGSSARLHRTARRGSTEDRPWLCDTCWSREVVGPRTEHVYASGVKYRPETDEDRAAVADLVGSIMSSTAKPAPRTPINVMPERPLVTALERMCTWLEHSELTADQSRLCESLLKKLQLCSASVMNAQLRRSWKPRDAS